MSAAAVEFDQHGYLSATLDGVAERAHVTRGSAYYHFASKADLANQLVLRQYEYWADFAQRRQTEGFKGVEVVMLLVHDLAISFRDDVASRAAIRLIKERDHIEADLPMPFERWMSVVRDLLSEAQGMGQIAASLDVDEVSWLVIAMFFGIQDIADQLEQRQNICSRLDSLWLHLLPGLGVADAPQLLDKIIAAA